MREALGVACALATALLVSACGGAPSVDGGAADEPTVVDQDDAANDGAADDAVADAKPEAAAADGEAAPADFRAMMDAYEAFVNEYVDFMETYQESDNLVVMAADYASMMTRLSEFNDQLEAIDEESLSADDYAYYIEVMNRCNQRMLEVSGV